MIPVTGTFSLNLVIFCICRYIFSFIMMYYKDMQMAASRKTCNHVSDITVNAFNSMQGIFFLLSMNLHQQNSDLV